MRRDEKHNIQEDTAIFVQLPTFHFHFISVWTLLSRCNDVSNLVSALKHNTHTNNNKKGKLLYLQ